MPEVKTAEDAYTLAKRAAWAGDLVQCRAWLAALSKLTGGRKKLPAWRPAALLKLSGQALRRRIKKRELPPDDLLVDTGHLRGVVWQTDRRSFELRAYLSDPVWEGELYRRARLAAERPEAALLTGRREEAVMEEVSAREKAVVTEAVGEWDTGQGIAWEEDADGMLCEATVSEFGLILVRGVWARRALPESAEEVKRRLSSILYRLETSDGIDSAHEPHESDLPA